MAKSGTIRLRIDIPSDRVANWMVINNKLSHKQGQKFSAWDGILFSLTQLYEPFLAGNLRPGLDLVRLEDASQGNIAEIKASEFAAGGFLYVVVGGTPGGGSGPSANPRDDAPRLWWHSLHHHTKSFPGGVIVWKHRYSEITISLPDLRDPNRSRVEFECTTDKSLEITHYKSDNTAVDYSGSVERIYIKGIDDPDPKDPMNPPRY